MYTAQPQGVLLWHSFTAEPVSVNGRCNSQNSITFNVPLFVRFVSRGQINKTPLHINPHKTKYEDNIKEGRKDVM
jgi:hypothetical protein